MAAAAVATARRIAIICALTSTVEPTLALVEEEGRNQGVTVPVTVVMCPHAWERWEAGDVDGYHRAIADAVEAVDDDHDTVILAQASMHGASRCCRRGPADGSSAPRAPPSPRRSRWHEAGRRAGRAARRGAAAAGVGRPGQSAAPPANAAACPCPSAVRPTPLAPATTSPSTRPVPSHGRRVAHRGVHPDLPVDRLVLRLWPNGGRRGPNAPTLTVDALSVDGVGGQRVRRPDPTRLDVELGRTVPAGTAITVALRFTLTVPGSSDERWSRSGRSMRMGTFHPVLAWEPGVGWNTTPATTARGEAVMTPVASYRLTVRTTPDLTVLASGAPAAGSAPGETVFTADAVRDVAVSIGRFRTATAMVDAGGAAPVAVTVGVAEGIGESPERYRDRVVSALRELARRYGRRPSRGTPSPSRPGCGVASSSRGT